MLFSRILEMSIRRMVTRGRPQDGVLSPLVNNGILMDVEQTGAKVVAYADDVVLLTGGKFL